MSNLKRFLALTLAMLMVVGAMVTVSAKSFEDVAATDSYAEAVDVLSELGVIAGTSADEFSPDTLVERQQMAMFIARLATAQPTWFAVDAAPVFADQTAPVYNAAIAYASTNGFVLGTSATTFNGAASVTLQEAATMLCRVLGYSTAEMNATWPMSYLTMADDVGLLAGLEDVAPTAALTRGEVATMLYNAFYARMAEKTVVYGTTGVPTVIVAIPVGSTYSTLAANKWKVATHDTYIEATKDFSFDASVAGTTKTLTDPVKFDGLTGTYSFATIAKFFPEDAVANDYLGVDLKVFIRNNKILSINVVGDAAMKTASYNADNKAVTVDGTVYDLDAYPINGTYPDASDNCFYIYNGTNIERVDNVTDVANIANGWYEVIVLNSGAATQKIVYKEIMFGQVGINADNKLTLGGVVITNNTLGAKKDDFVTYFSNGINLVEVKGIAVKSAGQKVVTINNTSKLATFDTGAQAPTTGTPINGASLATLSIGSSYYTYSVNGKVLKTEPVSAPATTYAPQSYYKVIAAAATTVDFTTTVKFQVVDAAGNTSVKVITNYDNDTTAITAVPAGVVGKFITLDGTKAYTSTTAAKYFTTFAGVADTDYSAATAVSFAKAAGSNLVVIDSTTDASFILADYSKILVEASDGYVAVSGKNFTSVAGTLTDAYAVIHKNEAGINELVYAFVKTDAAKAAAVVGATVDTTQKPYVFLGIEEETALTVKYNVFNLATGAVEQLTFTVADDAAKTTLKAAIAAASDAAISAYDVQSSTAAPASLGTVTPFKFATGYVVDGGVPYTLNNTKYYQWNATDDKLEAKTFADFAIGTSYEGVIITSSGNAAYVIVRATSAKVAVVTTPTPAPVPGEIVLATATTGATIYYTLDGSTPTLGSAVYSAPIVIPANTTYTVRAFAVKADMNNSDIVTVGVFTTIAP